MDAAVPDALALEARPSFLPSCVQLAHSLPDDLVGKLCGAPLRDLQETLEHVSLEDRLAWHETLLLTNEQLQLQRVRHRTTTTTTATTTAPGTAAPTAAAAPHEPLSPCWALTPTNVVFAFLARELALSEKVAAVRVAEERGLPLYGIELDDAAAYMGLAQGPLTAPDRHTAMMGPAGLGGDGAARMTSDGAAAPAPAMPVLNMDELESEQRRTALASLEPAVASTFRNWFQSVPQGDFRTVLQQQLAGLMPQCMGPQSYLSYMDETEALWLDERRVGRAAAAQYGKLTARREEHFLAQLRRVAGGGGAGGGPCRRLVAVMGRAHAARLRRALLQRERETPPAPPQ